MKIYPNRVIPLSDRVITEVIPKKQINPIAPALPEIEGYNCHMNFDPNTRGVAIYSLRSILVNEIVNMTTYGWKFQQRKMRRYCVDVYIDRCEMISILPPVICALTALNNLLLKHMVDAY